MSVAFLQEGVEFIPKLGHTVGSPVSGRGRGSPFVRAALGGASEIFGCPNFPRGVTRARYQITQELKVICSFPADEGGAVKTTVCKGRLQV